MSERIAPTLSGTASGRGERGGALASSGEINILMWSDYLPEKFIADFEGEKAELLLPDDHVPTPNGQIVYLVVSPPIDFEAYREMLYADIRADNARRKAEEEAAAEAKAKASSSA